MPTARAVCAAETPGVLALPTAIVCNIGNMAVSVAAICATLGVGNGTEGVPPGGTVTVPLPATDVEPGVFAATTLVGTGVMRLTHSRGGVISSSFIPAEVSACVVSVLSLCRALVVSLMLACKGSGRLAIELSKPLKVMSPTWLAL